MSTYIDLTTDAQTSIKQIKEAWDNAVPEVVTAEDILASDFGLLEVEIPLDILSLGEVSIKHTVDVPDTPNFLFSEAIQAATQNYQDLIAVIGQLDISTVVADVFQYIVTNVIGAEDELIVSLTNEISTLQQQLYGADEAPGGTGADAGIYENYQALLQYAFGPDGIPGEDVTLNSGVTLVGNGQLDGGIDQEKRDALTLAENLGDDVDYLFGEWAKFHIDLYGNDGPELTFTDANGNEFSSNSIGYTTQLAANYGFETGVGLLTALQQLTAGLVDEDIVNQLKVIIANRKQFMDEVIEDYVGVDLSGIEDALTVGELDPLNELVIQEGTNDGLVIRINNALNRIAERIPPAGLLTSIFTKVYPFIENNTIPTADQDLPGGIDGLLGMEGLSSADPFEASEALALQALEQDLQTIINYSSSQVQGEGGSAEVFSIVSLAQWLNAHRQLIGVNATDFNTIGVSPQTAFGFDIEGFIDQVITLPEGETIVQDSLASMAQLISFLQSGQLNAQQVKTLIFGFLADGDNSNVYADLNGDGAITVSDLLSFLSFYGLPDANPDIDSIEPESGYNQSEFNTSDTPFPNE